ncbi:uncharacterized protein LOC135847618 isoform X1 [Planococcus citri]|uniref:uncharacterized protein LOC135847618 isoform X1 n=1 Tax=Planococcus citri TaxID=170843 RepID=UPI0031F9E3A2
MTEISVPVVYDIAQPTPVSLKDLTAITISLEIWRNEIQKHRTNRTIERFNPPTLKISSKTVLPDIPVLLYDVIDEYVPRFGCSASKWLYSHYRRIFQSHRTNRNSILEVFDDFVADYGGTIDYVRTAKRMMVCDRLSEVEKFAIACTYFFHDDIRRMWSSVCQSFDLNKMDFLVCPQLFYWICLFRNELRRIPGQRSGRSVDEVMLHHHMIGNRPSVEYFWYQTSLINRMRKAIDAATRDKKLLVTFVLSKLNDQQLDEFVNTNGCKLILSLLNDIVLNSWFFQPTWKFIKNKVNESTFRSLVIEMWTLELTSSFEGCSKELQNWLNCCSEIWNSIPTNLKQSIAEDILSDRAFFQNMPMFTSSNRRFVGFLMIILSSATFERRSTFWRNCWPHLIRGTRSKDLIRMMKLCFENEQELKQFRDDIFAENENVRIWCSELLRVGIFDELNDLLDFCWSEVEIAKIYKQLLLRSTFPLENIHLNCQHIERYDEFNAFIDDTFDSQDEAANFKNQFMSSSEVQGILSMYTSVRNPSFEALMRFVDTFVSEQQTLHVIKERMIGVLTALFKNPENIYFVDCNDFKTPVFHRFLLWLLGNAEEVERFKGTHSLCIELYQSREISL